ncbi:MAG TPA: hypothetical protein DEF48_20390 [Nostoc sp. UBA8866]|uniref:hypothetical protein n=1 Tax=Nostoc sp. (strain PCC 7120 / SAG 25.82 / UTEX 2576) TaxID=103690 RepID=UPI0005CA0AAA|nr:hypothetical protein [Nostoc sp. PCC 7120 = FACHB-418]HBW32387.1 hypothetical protein [Nostoc sp. UBA8866]
MCVRAGEDNPSHKSKPDSLTVCHLTGRLKSNQIGDVAAYICAGKSRQGWEIKSEYDNKIVVL